MPHRYNDPYVKGKLAGPPAPTPAPKKKKPQAADLGPAKDTPDVVVLKDGKKGPANKKADLSPQEPKRIEIKKGEGVKEKDRPSEKMKRRAKSRDEAKSLSQHLLDAAAVMPPGHGPYGRALSAGVSGAAAGATLGEALANAHRQKAAAKKGGPKTGKKKPTLSEMAAQMAAQKAQAAQRAAAQRTSAPPDPEKSEGRKKEKE